MKNGKRNIIAAGVIAAFTFLMIRFSWFSNINLPLQDAVYQRTRRADASIKILAIDERTLEALGQFENWTREPYARLIEVLNEGEYTPAAIGLDILIINEKGAEDQLLIDACSKYSNVVMAENLVFTTKLEKTDGKVTVNRQSIQMAELPFAGLREHVRTGFVNTIQDPQDNSVRYTRLGCEGHESFASALVQTAQANRASDAGAAGTSEAAETGSPATGETAVASPLSYMPADANGGIFINYVGGSESFETLSMIDVLEGRIPAAAFADSIVLVGAHAAGMGDVYTVPVQKGAQMYGVEIHANILQNLLEQTCLVQADRTANALVCAILAFALALLLANVKLWIGGLFAAAVIAAQYVFCLKLDGRGVIVHVLGLPAAALLSLVWGIVSKYTAEALQKRKIMHAFQKYVAPQVVEEISKNHDYRLRLGGEKRHIAVLFVDIRGFTPMSEALEPEQVVEILNEYLGLVTQAIFKNGGTLDKFIGDAAMAVFNAPFDSEDYIFKAVCAARDIAAGGDEIAKKFMERFGRTVSYGIGVNCGDAVVGNIGCEFRMDYTAIGDTVNTAARLEANAKAGQILISEYVYQEIADRIEVTAIGEIPLKGKSRGVMVYAVDRVTG